MSKRHVEPVQRFGRVGEGPKVRAEVQFTPEAGGHSSVSVGVDLSTAVVPDRRYTADIANLDVNEDYVKWIFGQRQVIGDKLRSLLVINMPLDAAGRFLRSSEELHGVLQARIDAGVWKAAVLYEVQEEPEQAVGLEANIVGVATANGEACMDFYHLSAYVSHQIHQQRLPHGIRDIPMDAVVRVTLPSRVLLALREKLVKAVDQSILAPEVTL